MTENDKIDKKRVLGLGETPETPEKVSEKTPENNVKCCGDNLDGIKNVDKNVDNNRPYRNIYDRVKELEDTKELGFTIISALNERIMALEGLVEELVTRRKVDELTGKGERYETKLLNVKTHDNGARDDNGNPIKAEPVKPEHCTAEELFKEAHECSKNLKTPFSSKKGDSVITKALETMSRGDQIVEAIQERDLSKLPPRKENTEEK